MNLELILLHSDTSPSDQQTQYQFDESGGTIGRDDNCNFVLNCQEKVVSRSHARIEFKSNRFIIHDTSSNGVFINKENNAIGNGSSLALKNGDTIRIGQFELAATMTGENPATTATIRSVPSVKTSPDATGTAQKAVADHKNSTPPPSASQPLHHKSGTSSLGIGASAPSDNFVPPSVVIPDNWDTDIVIDDGNAAKDSPEKQQEPLHFINQQTKLVNELLKGMGVNKHVIAEQITAETMALVGRCLRVAIDGNMTQRQWIHRAKIELCLDKAAVERHIEADTTNQINTTDEFLKALLDSHHPVQTALPDILTDNHNDVLDDQKDMFQGISDTIEQLQQGLSPQAIETAFDEQQRDNRTPPIAQLGHKFSLTSKKWQFYQEHWKLACQKAVSTIRKNFESNILLAHTKRMKSRKDATR